MECRVQCRVEHRVECRVECRVKYRVQSRVEYRVKYRVQSRVEYRVQSRVECRVDDAPNGTFHETLDLAAERTRDLTLNRPLDRLLHPCATVHSM